MCRDLRWFYRALGLRASEDKMAADTCTHSLTSHSGIRLVQLESKEGKIRLLD
jgi:hypothetical protein